MFAWSSEAETWIQNEIAAETAGPARSGTSYYQVIDGNRYDRKVLDDCRRSMNNDGEEGGARPPAPRHLKP
jgi:hypothetical protein